MVCFGEGAAKISKQHVDAAIADTEDATVSKVSLLVWVLAIGAIIGMISAVIYWLKGGVA